MRSYVIMWVFKPKVTMEKLFKKIGFVMSGSLLLACSCSSKPQKQAETKPEEMKMEQTPSGQKGPEQQPFQHCDALDSECEEGASSDVLKQVEEASLVVEATDSTDAKEQALFVTPLVIEAVQMKVPEASAPLAQEANAGETNATETAAVSSSESAS